MPPAEPCFLIGGRIKNRSRSFGLRRQSEAAAAPSRGGERGWKRKISARAKAGSRWPGGVPYTTRGRWSAPALWRFGTADGTRRAKRNDFTFSTKGICPLI